MSEPVQALLPGLVGAAAPRRQGAGLAAGRARPLSSGIVAITRGGLVPAHIIARELDIRVIDTVCISSYDDQTQREADVLKSVAGDGAGWLIVDDLVDTGATGRIVREMLPKAHFATVYAKPAGPADGRHLHHRGQPGHLDPVPLGHRAPIRAPIAAARAGSGSRA